MATRGISKSVNQTSAAALQETSWTGVKAPPLSPQLEDMGEGRREAEVQVCPGEGEGDGEGVGTCQRSPAPRGPTASLGPPASSLGTTLLPRTPTGFF